MTRRLSTSKSFAAGSAFSAAQHSFIAHWFRRDLRLTDNVSLTNALCACAKHALPLYAFYILPSNNNHSNDNNIGYGYQPGIPRSRFLLETLTNLHENLRSRCNVSLHILKGSPASLPDMLSAMRVKELYFEAEYAPDARARDTAVINALKERAIPVRVSHGFMLYDPARLINDAPYARAPRNMSAFLTLAEAVGHPRPPRPFNDGREVHACVAGEVQDTGNDKPLVLLEGFEKVQCFDMGMFGHDTEEVSKVDDEGVNRVKGGEEEGMKLLEEFLGRDNGIAVETFSKPETSPAAFRPFATTRLSAYLAVGAISARTVYSRVHALEKRRPQKCTLQTRLRGQLLWREHFWLLASQMEDLHKEGNDLCRDIHWDRDEQAEIRFNAWKNAKTGYPWIDALMNQLITEGFVHHLGRHSLACFLTRGDLWVSWTKGAQVFEERLIDFDYALNAANWMWLSCSAFFNAYHRVYSPVAFAKKWDPQGEFIRHYLPVLKEMPDKYVHEPWKAPLHVQREAGCIVGKHYPERIVLHDVARNENITKMSIAFKRSKDAKLNAPESKEQEQVKSKTRGKGNGKRQSRITGITGKRKRTVSS